jgi:hypothetical protein
MGQDNRISLRQGNEKHNMDSEVTTFIHLVLSTACLSSLQWVFEISAVNFEADGNALHGIFLHTPQHAGIDSCNLAMRSSIRINPTN